MGFICSRSTPVTERETSAHTWLYPPVLLAAVTKEILQYRLACFFNGICLRKCSAWIDFYIWYCLIKEGNVFVIMCLVLGIIARPRMDFLYLERCWKLYHIIVKQWLWHRQTNPKCRKVKGQSTYRVFIADWSIRITAVLCESILGKLQEVITK